MTLRAWISICIVCWAVLPGQPSARIIRVGPTGEVQKYPKQRDWQMMAISSRLHRVSGMVMSHYGNKNN